MTATVNELVRNFNLMDLPIGIYFVRADGQILACNRAVRELLDLPLEGPVSANIADFYANPSDRPAVLQKAQELEEHGRHLERLIIPFRVSGRDLYVEVYARSLRDPTTQNILGYAVCIVDVTQEQEADEQKVALQRRVEELTFDIGRVLHSNTSVLVMSHQALDAAAETVGRRRLDDLIQLSPEEMDEQLSAQAAQLAGAVERLTQAGDAERRLQAIPQAKWDALSSKVYPLQNVKIVVPVAELRPSTLRREAHEISSLIRAIRPGILPREPLRDCLQAAEQVAQTGCLIDLLTTRTAVIQMDTSLRTLRDYITSDVRTPEQRTRLPVKQLVEQSIAQLAEFAKSARVDIQWKERNFDGVVEGNERDLIRALSNLLHNAIKYTWRRERSKGPWVSVRTYARAGTVYIEFENWGVPISREELDSKLIFELGYRGQWATDRGRLGTGIGLTDAWRVAQAHHGDLRIESRPANPGHYRPDDEEYYHQPFITTVTLCLPPAK